MKSVPFIIFVCTAAFLLSACSSEIAFEVPDMKVARGDSLSLPLIDFVSGAGNSEEIYFSLLSGKGKVIGGTYELENTKSCEGVFEVEIVAITSGKRPEKAKFTVEIVEKNLPPEGRIPDLEISEGQIVHLPLDPLISDPEGMFLTYDVKGDFREGFAQIADSFLILSPEYKDAGIKEIVVVAYDEDGLSREFSFNVITEITNNPPFVSIPDLVVQEFRTVSVDLKEYVYDQDGDDVFFRISSENSGWIENGVYNYRASSWQDSPLIVNLQVEDSRGAIAEETFEISFTKAIDGGEGVHTVGVVGGRYETIQEAINAADSGDVIKIFSGVYVENVSISKNLVLIGSSSEEVVIRPKKEEDPAIFVRGVNDFVIENISVESGASAINISRSSGRIANCRIAGGRFGVAFSGDGMTVEITDSYITSLMGVDNDDYLSTRLVGIYAYGDANLFVRNSVIERTGTGMNFSNGLKYSVEDSKIVRNSLGVTVSGTAEGHLKGNSIFQNVDNGVLLNITSTATLTDNLFFGNVRHGLDLYLKNCTDCGCGGTTFRGTVLGSGNIFDSLEEICPADYWEEGFYTIDETLGKETGE